MYINNVNCDIIEMACRQLGATKVSKINGSLYQFEFDIGTDCKLAYSFNVNHKTNTAFTAPLRTPFSKERSPRQEK